MKRYDDRADQQRRASLRFSTMLGTASLFLVVVLLLIIGLRHSAPSDFYTKSAIVVAALLLVMRQVTRRLRGKGPKAAQPDPKSTLKLS